MTSSGPGRPCRGNLPSFLSADEAAWLWVGGEGGVPIPLLPLKPWSRSWYVISAPMQRLITPDTVFCSNFMIPMPLNYPFSFVRRTNFVPGQLPGPSVLCLGPAPSSLPLAIHGGVPPSSTRAHSTGVVVGTGWPTLFHPPGGNSRRWQIYISSL